MELTFAGIVTAFSAGLLLILAVVALALFSSVPAVQCWATSWFLAGFSPLALFFVPDQPALSQALVLASGLALVLGCLSWWKLSPAEGKGALPRTVFWGGSGLMLVPLALDLPSRDPFAWCVVALWVLTPSCFAIGLFWVRSAAEPRPSLRTQSRSLMLALVLGPLPFALSWVLAPILVGPEWSLGLLPVSVVGAALTLRALYRFDSRFPHQPATRFLVERTQDPVVFLGSDGLIQAANPAFVVLVDQVESILVGRRPSDLGAETESRRLLAPLESLTFPDWEGEVALMDKAGSAIPVHVVYRRMHNQARQAIGAVLLVHDLRRSTRFNLASREDTLTSLSNRRWVLELLEAEFLRAQRYGGSLSVLWLKVEDKSDEGLRKIAAVLVGALRKTDFCGRLGEDEFLVVLPETTAERANIVAGRFKTMYALAAEESAAKGLLIGLADLDQKPSSVADFVARARVAVPAGTASA